jgi:predicted nucleic acid-binding protein
MIVALALVDTNVLIYRFDLRFPRKQKIATEVLRRGLADGTARIPHQAIIEFVAVATRLQKSGEPVLSAQQARSEAEGFLNQFEVLYPNDALVRLALRGTAAYQFSWWDAHLWAYAEYYAIPELLSEDFQHDRLYGMVRAVNPFL